MRRTTSPVRAGQMGGMGSSSPLPYLSQSSPVSTPARSRGDIGSVRRGPQLDLVSPSSQPEEARGPSSTDMANPTSDSGQLGRTVIWGTSVNLAETKQRFTEFVSTFVEEDAEDVNDPKYLRGLRQIRETNRTHLNVDCRDLKSFSDELYRLLVRYPQEVVPIFDVEVNEIFRAQFPDHELESDIQVRTYGLDKVTTMRDLNPEDIDQMIAIKGMVIRCSPIIPDPKEAFFECLACSNTVTVEIERGNIAEPKVCSQCKTAKSFQLVHNRCRFADKQSIKLQETPEMVPDGATPQTVLAFSYDELTDGVQPGDRVEVTAIYRATPLRVVSRQRTVKAVYKTHLDVIHFNKVTGSRMRLADEEEEDPAVAAQYEEKIKALAAEPDIYDRLTRALAPNIFEFDDVKRGVLLQLFGGSHKDFKESGRGRFRGEINVLLCGDPGTSKSQMLQYAVNIAARGLYTSGKGSSSVGLTAYVTKDPETRQLVLESGALVLCDGGVCCIDEFDKMSDNTRSVLHEAMEQQTVSIAKAGIICSLNARTSILAAANPVDSRWNPNMSIVENIQLPPTLLSRFDLIYLILDTPDKLADRRLANHLVALYYQEEDRPEQPDTMNRDLLSRYISYARANVQPRLTEEAGRDLVTGYVEMRKLGSGKKTITATPRQLESLIRISEAHARIRLSEHVERTDVAEALRLVKTAMRQAATDPRTGQIDMDLLTTGQSMAARNRIGDLSKAVAGAMTGANRTIEFGALLTKLQQSSDISISPDDLRAALGQMLADEAVTVQGGLRAPNPTIKLQTGAD